MHPNPVFHTQTEDQNLAFARERAFGVLAVSGSEAPWLSHVPFLLDEDGASLGLHLLRSNPIARALTERRRPARLAVSGPDSYVSPDWYGVDDEVPTWNYIAVHLTGTLELRPQAELHDLLDRQSAVFEERLLPKTPWVTGKMSDGVMARMMRAIVPCRMQVTEVDGTWKLNQNKPDAVRQQAADHVEAFGQGTELAVLAALMRGANGQRP
ncbi:FMN-binding negative transcriptional regulator [Roseobacter sinensis]|uniref:FMN-binding negative transcriptional regulator n=1 Tax=Roseobacter sinensis TaxID=2931391 RepID=A0ABT3B9F6_9RHOB|nr:FMN-binding negative transcriptional regulator [Roseobacter sp. WL0113]MCV3269804.1 FMN-binding negative transcriptional regulator [Roseobacter sp. WL0113]